MAQFALGPRTGPLRVPLDAGAARPLAAAQAAATLLPMQAAAGVEPQIDIDQFGFVRAAHTEPVTFGGRRDSIDAAIAFLGDVKAIATDKARGLAGGLSAAVIRAIPGFTP